MKLDISKEEVKKRTLSILVFVLIFVALEIYGRSVSPILFSPPSKVFWSLYVNTLNGMYPLAVADTFKSFLCGVALAMAVGLPLGFLMGLFKTVENNVDPIISAFYSMPMAPIIPILILVMGLGWHVKVFYVFIFSFFVVTVNVHTGVKYVEGKYLEVGRIFGATRMQSFLKIVLPGALPMTMAGVRLCLGRGIRGMLAAEMLMLTSGLGYLVLSAGAEFNTEIVEGVILIMMILGVLMTWLTNTIHKKVAPWSSR